MKNGKKPTREQRKSIEAAGLDTYEWKIVRIYSDSYEIISTKTSEIKRIPR